MAISGVTYTTSGTTLAHTGAVRFWGFSATNTTANPATVTVYDSLTAAGLPLYSVTFAANTANIVILPQYIQATIGVTLILTGTTPNVVGSVFME